MTPSPPPPHPDEPSELLASYALNALDASEALHVEAMLAADPELDAEVLHLQSAAGELAALAATRPPDRLRARVLGTAITARPGRSADPIEAVEMHQIECAHLEALAHRLEADNWAVEVPGAWTERGHRWTVQQVFGHVTATEQLLAERLGANLPTTPEAHLGDDHEVRGIAAADRHATLTPADTVAELHLASAATQAAAAALSDDDLESDIQFYGVPMRISTALILLSFEKWIHADDIRRALDWPDVPPPAGSVATMSDRAVRLVPLSLAVAEITPPEATLVVHLTGTGGGTWEIDLTTGDSAGGPGRSLEDAAAEAASSTPRTIVRADAVDWCRAFADRLHPDDLYVEIEGDRDLAGSVISNLSNLVGV